MLTARVDRELLAAFDAVAEGRGGWSALLRTVLQQSLKHVADAPRIAPRADSPSNRVNLRFTDVETAVLDHRAAQRGVDRAGWIKALVRRHLALKAGVDDGLRDAVAPIRMQLTRIGRNLNQAMKAGNAAMMADSGLQIDRELRRIADMREEINRSEEHTSELQSLMRISYAVFCLKKKKRLNQTDRKCDKNIAHCQQIQSYAPEQ